MSLDYADYRGDELHDTIRKLAREEIHKRLDATPNVGTTIEAYHKGHQSGFDYAIRDVLVWMLDRGWSPSQVEDFAKDFGAEELLKALRYQREET